MGCTTVDGKLSQHKSDKAYIYIKALHVEIIACDAEAQIPARKITS